VPFKAANLLIIHLNFGASTCGGYHAYFFFFARFLLYKFHTELAKREKVEKNGFSFEKEKMVFDSGTMSNHGSVVQVHNINSRNTFLSL
jgi:hypothetical protein